jgi:predicted nucleotidyltransferase
VYLFGSYARDETDENSDVDLLIDWYYSKHIGLNYVFWREEIINILHKNFDFVSLEYIAAFIEE